MNLGLLKFFLIVLFYSNKLFAEPLQRQYANFKLLDKLSNKLDEKTGLFYNSLLLVDNKFELIQQYNKQKLVPFGEFLPFESLFSKLGFKTVSYTHLTLPTNREV